VSLAERVDRAYGPSGSAAERERLIVDFVPLVHHVLARLPIALPPSLDRDDLVSAGLCGLVQASQSYDPRRGASFKSHAFTRIRGSILDELRRVDPIPKQKRERLRELDAACVRCRDERGTPPTVEELADAMGTTTDEVEGLLLLSRWGAPLSLDAGEDDETSLHDRVPGHDEGPSARASRAERLAALAEAMAELAPREREVMGLYYHDGLLLREIGKLLGITESRVCQLHARAIFTLRAGLARRGVTDAQVADDATRRCA